MKAIIAVVALALMVTSSFSEEATFRVKRDKAHLQNGYAPIVASQPAYGAQAPAYHPQPQYPSTIPVPLPIPLAPSSIYLPRPPPQPAAPQYHAPAPYQAPAPQYQASAPAPQYQPAPAAAPSAPAAYQSAPPPPPSYSAAPAPPPPAPYAPPPPRPVSYAPAPAPAPAPASYAPPPPPPPPAQYAPAPTGYAPAPAAYAPAPAPAPAAYAPAPAPAPAAYAPAPAPAPAAYAPAPAPAPVAYAPAPAPAPAAYAPAPAPAPAPVAYAPAPVPAPAPAAYAPVPAPAPAPYVPAPVAAPAQPQYAPAPLPAPAPYAAPAPTTAAPVIEISNEVAIASPDVSTVVVQEVAVAVATEAPAIEEGNTGSYTASGPVTVPPVFEEATTAPPVDAVAELTENDIRAVAPLPVPAAPAAPVPAEGAKAPEKSQWTEGSIPSVLEKMGLNTLNDLLILAELDETLDKGGPFTVFVPVDQAFEVLIQRFGGMEVAEKQFNENPEVLTSLLKHHVVSGVIPSTALQNNMVVPSLLQTPLRVKFYESEKADWTPLKVPTDKSSPPSSNFLPSQVVTINGARVIRPNIQAKNGMIHIVDRVIFNVPQADVYSTLKGDKEQRYSTLVSAIERAGLVPVLANPQAGPFTVFAPTNKAFSLLSPSELNAILSDPVKLTNLLKRHVVQDLIYTSGLQGFQKAYALDFELLFIYHAKGMTKVNGANVVDQDLTALNGVIHTIDSVLGL